LTEFLTEPRDIAQFFARMAPHTYPDVKGCPAMV